MGETPYQGEKWHRIKTDDGERFLISPRVKTLQNRLNLERVDFDGINIVKSPVVTRSPIKDKVREMGMELGRFLGLSR